MTQTTNEREYENNIANCEANHIHDANEYFDARPQIDSLDRRKVFESGYTRGWQAALSSQEQGQAVAEIGIFCTVHNADKSKCDLHNLQCAYPSCCTVKGETTPPKKPLAVPSGFALMPKSLPYDEMRRVIVNYFDRATKGESFLFDDFYADMLNAAPTPPESE